METTGSKQRGAQTTLECLFVFASSMIFFWYFADQNGYEGDDLNIIVPMLSLPETLSGYFVDYKYDWQPLTYWLGWAIYQAFDSISLVFLLSGIGMAVGLALLYEIIVYRIGLKKIFFLPLLLLMPEFFFTGLYFNSTAIGFPFAVLAISLSYRRPSYLNAILTGLSLGTAVLLRLDFALVAPTIWVLRVVRLRSLGDAILVIAAGLACLCIGYITGLIDIDGVLQTYDISRNEIIERGDSPGWNLRTKVMVATAIFSPLGWLAVLASLIYLMVRRGEIAWLTLLLLGASLLPFVYTLQNLLTVKYMVPVFPLLIIGFAAVLNGFADRMTRATKIGIAGAWITLTAINLFFSVEPSKQAPFIKITHADAFQVGTHDSARSWGAFVPQFIRVDLSDIPRQNELIARDLFVRARDGELTEIWMQGDTNYFSRGGMAWRTLFVMVLQEGGSFEVERPQVVTLSIGQSKFRLADVSAVIPTNACVWQLDGLGQAEIASAPDCLIQGGS